MKKHRHTRQHHDAAPARPAPQPVYECENMNILPVNLGLPVPSGRVTVILDAGHGTVHGGTFDSGAKVGHVRESDVTAAEAKAVAASLRAAGYRVIATNDSHAPKKFSDRCDALEHRVGVAQNEIANGVGKFLFISLHADTSPDSSQHGIHVYSQRGDAVSAQFAAIAARAFRHDHIPAEAATADYYVLRNNANMAALLIETGYLTNASDRKRLTSPAYHQLVAENITQAVSQFAPLPTPAPTQSVQRPRTTHLTTRI